MSRLFFLFAIVLVFTSSSAKAQPAFVRGDCNGDLAVGIADPVALLGYLFSGGSIDCQSACDANDDGSVQLSDAIAILGSLFSGSGPLPEPFPACGTDPTPDTLTCASTPCVIVTPSTDNLREVDVASLGGTPGGDGLLVSVAGSGAQHQLSSWLVPDMTGAPQLRDTTAPIDGHHARVAFLPTVGIVTGQPRFASAAIRDDGNIWVSSRRLDAAGDIQSQGTVGYGENAGVRVLAYDIDVRPIYAGLFLVSSYQIVTAVVTEPIAGGSQSIRIVSWGVNPSTGAITGLDDSGNLPFTVPQFLTADDLALDISHQNGIQYVLNFTNASDELENHFFWVENDGSVVYAGGTAGGSNIRGTGDVSVEQFASAIAPVTESGYVTASRQLDGTLRMSVWERRDQGFLTFEPYQLTDDSFDQFPAGPGVYVPSPTLTDSWTWPGRSGDLLGHDTVSGDFNGDGFDDVVIAAPFRAAGGQDNAGEILVIHGQAGDGITGGTYTQVWSQATPGVAGAHEANDRFGEAMAVGDFDGDGIDDLAVASVNESVGSTQGGGAVSIFYGTPFGLSTTDNFIFTQEDLGYTTNAFDYFGYSLTAADYDGDGRDDLAIGCPYREIGGHTNAGAVYVAWGTTGGLSMSGATLLHQDSVGIWDEAEDVDQFGFALTSGDFNGDGNFDLVITAPREDIGSTANAGAVHILYGNAGGFGANNFVSQGGFAGGEEIIGAVEAEDLFGWSVAAGDFDGDGAWDLAIGVPGEDDGSVEDAGAINVLYGTIFGLTHINNLVVTQNTFNPIGGDLPGVSEEDDQFGTALVTGDFDGDGYSDLVVAAPWKDVPIGCGNPVDRAGAVFAIYGSTNGLTSSGATRIHQNLCDADGSPEPFARYGWALTAGDYNADGEDDLVVAAPWKDRDEDNPSTGAIHILPGSPSGFDLDADEEWLMRAIETVRARVTDMTWEAMGPGFGSLYQEGVALDPAHVASVTKCMTLLLAVEAIEAGHASLSDQVDVSDLAGNTGGSYLEVWDDDGVYVDDDGNKVRFIQPGDTMPLRLLLHGMMMRSGNRCSVAIGQHIAQRVTGNPDDFVSMMNDRAAQLGMGNTICGHPAGGMSTKTQDLINLMMEGWEHPLFRQISSTELYGDIAPAIELCGLDSMGMDKCNSPWTKIATIGAYPGRLGYKGGNGRLWWGSSEPYGYPGAQPPGYCTAAAVAVVERADRRIAIALQQSGSRSSDAQDLLDYGFRQVFTPDRLTTETFPAVGGIVGPGGPIRVNAFAIDSISGDRCVTAVIDDNEELRLNIWGTDFASGAISALGSASETYVLPAGVVYAPSPLVRIARSWNGDSIGDYFTASLDGQHLDLQIWRIGETP